MSQIHLARNNVVLGQFTEAEITAGLQSGAYLPTDLAWRTGMAQWKPLAVWPEFTSSAAPLPFSSVEAPPFAFPQNMPDWERKNEIGLFSALVRTTKQVLQEPDATFSRLRREGGLGGPLFYYLIPQVALGLLFSVFIGVAVSMGVFSASHNHSNPAEQKLAELVGSVSGVALAIGYLLFFIVMAPLGLFISAGIHHLMLKLWGACTAPFETTFRVTAYAWGAYALVSLPLTVLGCIPCIGIIFSLASLAFMVWGLIVLIKGLMITHGSSGLRVCGAVFTPVILCCCAYGVILMMIFGAAAAGSHH